MSSADRAIFMRLVHVRAAVLSLLAGGFLALGVLAGWPGAARAGTVKASAASLSASTSARASATASTSTSAGANTDTKCEVLPTASTPTPHPSSSSPTPSPSPSPSASATAPASGSTSSKTPESPPPTSATPTPSPGSPSSASASASTSATGSPSQTGSASASSSQSSAAATISASLDAFIAASPASSASSSPASPADQPELCVSVQRSQASISRGQQAAYVVRVSTENNGSAANVTVALTAQPSGQKPTFTSGCAKGAGTASCTVSAVSDKQPVSLKAQIPVAAGATSVTSVKLTATASIATTEKWTPLSAAETVAVIAASASPAQSSAGSSSAGVSPGGALLLGPIPNLNGVSSQLIGAGNAAGLFPAINPSATPSPSPGSPAPGSQRRPAPDSSAIAFIQPGLTGQVAGLIALAVAVLLTVTRLSLRRRFRSRKQGG